MAMSKLVTTSLTLEWSCFDVILCSRLWHHDVKLCATSSRKVSVSNDISRKAGEGTYHTFHVFRTQLQRKSGA